MVVLVPLRFLVSEAAMMKLESPWTRKVRTKVGVVFYFFTRAANIFTCIQVPDAFLWTENNLIQRITFFFSWAGTSLF